MRTFFIMLLFVTLLSLLLTGTFAFVIPARRSVSITSPFINNNAIVVGVSSNFSDDPPMTAEFTDYDDEENDIDIAAMAGSDNNSIINNSLMDNIWAARALLMLIAIIWGTNFAAVKYLETLCFHPPCIHPPSEAALARFGIAALVSIPLLFGQKKEIIFGGFECGLWITIGYITQAMALSSITAGKCAFICSLTVVVVPLLSAALFGKELKPMHIVAAAVALSGVGILEGMIDFNQILHGASDVAKHTPTPHHIVAAASSSAHAATTGAASAATSPLAQISEKLGLGKGDLIALGQPVGFGCAFMRIEHYVEKFKNIPNQVLTLSAAQCVSVGVLALLWVLHDFHGTIPDMGYMLEPHRMVAIGWTGIVTTVLAIYLEGIALKTATATDAALTFASEPVWASIFGVWLLNEHLSTNSYVGGAVILVACVLGALSDMPAINNYDNQQEQRRRQQQQ